MWQSYTCTLISYTIFNLHVTIDFEYMINGYSMHKLCFGCVPFKTMLLVAIRTIRHWNK